MTLSQEFANLPTTIFDEEGGDLDVSEEMEEIRELLYELIKTNFPSGVTAEHLANVYKDTYEPDRTNEPLPKDWLEHIRMAEEFEVVNRGPIVMVYTRQRNAPPLKADPTAANRLNISRTKTPGGKRDKMRIRLSDKELAQQMKSVLVYSPVKTGSALSVVVMACEDANKITIQLTTSTTDFEQLRTNMDAHYNDLKLGQPLGEGDAQINGVFAVRDTDQHWYRAVLQASSNEAMCCLLVDTGKEMRVNHKDIMHLCPDFALPSSYPIYGIGVSLDASTDQTSSLCAIRAALHTQQPILLRFLSMDGSIGGIHTVQCASSTDEHVTKPNRKLSSQPSLGKASDSCDLVELVPMHLSEMPSKRFAVHVLAVFDVGNISIRQRSLDPIPDYIASAVERDSMAQQNPPTFSDLVEGGYYAARVNGDTWERVRFLGTSSVDADCFRVYSLDSGAFGIVRRHNLRFLRIPVGLRKVLLAKCKIGGIKSLDGSDAWSCDCQTALCSMLASSGNVEVDPIGDWKEYPDTNCPHIPFVTAKLLADGKDVAHQLVAMGLALRS